MDLNTVLERRIFIFILTLIGTHCILEDEDVWSKEFEDREDSAQDKEDWGDPLPCPHCDFVALKFVELKKHKRKVHKVLKLNHLLHKVYKFTVRTRIIRNLSTFSIKLFV